MMSEVFLCVILFHSQMVSAQYYKLFLPYHICCVLEEMHPELIENLIILCDNATVH